MVNEILQWAVLLFLVFRIWRVWPALRAVQSATLTLLTLEKKRGTQLEDTKEEVT